MNKENIKEKATAFFAMLSVMILIASIFVPLAGATNNGGKVIEKALPKIEIKENSRTLQIVQIGDTLITLTADQNHTKGVLKVKNLKTGKVKTTNIKVNKKKGKYYSSIESSVVPSSYVTTDYDPFEPGTTAQMIKNNQVNSNVVPTTWIWDNITFKDGQNGLGQYYPHPDYESYPDIDWNQFPSLKRLQGYALEHNHIDSTTSSKLIPLSIFVFALIIGVLMEYPNPIDLAGKISNYVYMGLRYTMLDETGAIWFWDTIGSDKFAYFRIAAFTIQDKLHIGNPRPGTMPPVIDTVTLDNYTPNAGYSINIIVNVTDNIGISKVTANGNYLTNRSICIPNVECVWNGSIIAENGKHIVDVLAYDTEGNIARNDSVSYTGQIQIISDRLTTNQQLKQNQAIVSQNGNYELILQGDGNVVLYNKLNNAIWSTRTQTSKAQELIMQNDGNLVLYKYINQIQPLWATNTQGNMGAYVVMQNDGNLVVYSSSNRPLWASNTVGR